MPPFEYSNITTVTLVKLRQIPTAFEGDFWVDQAVRLAKTKSLGTAIRAGTPMAATQASPISSPSPGATLGLRGSSQAVSTLSSSLNLTHPLANGGDASASQVAGPSPSSTPVLTPPPVVDASAVTSTPPPPMIDGTADAHGPIYAQGTGYGESSKENGPRAPVLENGPGAAVLSEAQRIGRMLVVGGFWRVCVLEGGWAGCG